jgi:hypothetical protein
MQHKRQAENEKRPGNRKEILLRRTEALAIREVYPAEEFAGFESFGEFPEWRPGEAGKKDTQVVVTD